MKYSLLSIMVIFSLSIMRAQTDLAVPTDTTRITGSENDEKIYEFTEQRPVYPGGDQALIVFISQNLVYPEDELEKGISGIVYVQLIVEKDGTTSGHKILRGLSRGSGLEREAIRVAKLIRFEKPALHHNLPVRYSMLFPIRVEVK
jgi:TonB family protein